jgi:L-fucose isomerase
MTQTNPAISSLSQAENHPKIGIRPAIDGRRKGVRESLEDTTLALAKAVADLLSRNLRHRDGTRVECVIPDTCIGGVAEAAQTARLFSRQGVGLSITVTPC